MKATLSPEIMDLAKEIVIHLQSKDHKRDIDFVARWLLHGGDNGESATDLAMKFESEEQLPSRGQS